jgi:hypothetical protein
MNANELADELYDLDVQASQQSLNDWAEQAATMLRQQQAEIEDLKQQVAFLEDWRDTWSPFLKAITGKVNEK